MLLRVTTRRVVVNVNNAMPAERSAIEIGKHQPAMKFD